MKKSCILFLIFLFQTISFCEQVTIKLSIKPYWVYVTSSDGSIKTNNKEKDYIEVTGEKGTNKTVTFKKVGYLQRKINLNFDKNKSLSVHLLKKANKQTPIKIEKSTPISTENEYDPYSLTDIFVYSITLFLLSYFLLYLPYKLLVFFKKTFKLNVKKNETPKETVKNENFVGGGTVFLSFFITFLFIYYKANDDSFGKPIYEPLPKKYTTRNGYIKGVYISDIPIINETDVSYIAATRFYMDIDISKNPLNENQMKDYAQRIGEYYVRYKNANAIHIYFIITPNNFRIAKYQFTYAPFGKWEEASIKSNYKLSKIKRLASDRTIEQVVLAGKIDKKEKENIADIPVSDENLVLPIVEGINESYVDIDISKNKLTERQMENYSLRLGQYYVKYREVDVLTIYFIRMTPIGRKTKFSYTYAPFGRRDKAHLKSNHKLSEIEILYSDQNIDEMIEEEKQKKERFLQMMRQ